MSIEKCSFPLGKLHFSNICFVLCEKNVFLRLFYRFKWKIVFVYINSYLSYQKLSFFLGFSWFLKLFTLLSIYRSSGSLAPPKTQRGAPTRVGALLQKNGLRLRHSRPQVYETPGDPPGNPPGPHPERKKTKINGTLKSN